MAQYRATVGIDYPPNKRVEAGEVVSDLPGDSIKWLLDQGLIEALDGKSTPKIETKVEEPVVEVTPEENRAVPHSTMEETAPEEAIAETPASEESEAE